eukprot:m.18165 g.18165  ORF g.18165 m.18165 type:complete len:70 (+) comp11865_c0_seq1:993-1202(+)
MSSTFSVLKERLPQTSSENKPIGTLSVFLSCSLLFSRSLALSTTISIASGTSTLPQANPHRQDEQQLDE